MLGVLVILLCLSDTIFYGRDKVLDFGMGSPGIWSFLLFLSEWLGNALFSGTAEHPKEITHTHVHCFNVSWVERELKKQPPILLGAVDSLDSVHSLSHPFSLKK